MMLTDEAAFLGTPLPDHPPCAPVYYINQSKVALASQYVASQKTRIPLPKWRVRQNGASIVVEEVTALLKHESLCLVAVFEFVEVVAGEPLPQYVSSAIDLSEVIVVDNIFRNLRKTPSFISKKHSIAVR